MSTIAIAALGGVAGTAALIWLGRWVTEQLRPWLLPIVGGMAALVVASWAALRLLSGVLSLHGLAYSVGVADVVWQGHTLTWPTAVRVTTLLVAAELAAGVAWLVDRHRCQQPEGACRSWAWAHLSGPGRLVGAGVWYLLIAPATVACDAWHRRGVAWPRRPERFATVAGMAADRARDVADGLAALATPARRLRWRRYVSVARVLPVDRHRAGTVIEADFTDQTATPLRTWRLRGDRDQLGRRRSA
jgi:hypothetical protein